MRSSTLRRGIFLALALLLPGACAPSLSGGAPEPATTVVVVRHAERASETDPDPPLSAAGEARAAALAEALADAGVTAVFSTPYQRTRSTAAPLAARLGIPVQVEDAAGGAEESTAALARKILAEHAGGTVLVVGHSNTVHLVVRALGGSAIPALQSDDYDGLYVVIIPDRGPARTLLTRYGAR